MPTHESLVLRRPGLGEEVPSPLRAEVRLLGDVLGQVLVEAGGAELLDDVERLRQATIALRGEPTEERRQAVVDVVAGLDLDRSRAVARAFTLYFQLINLAEEHHRLRTLRERGRDEERVADSLAAAVADIIDRDGADTLDGLLAGLRINPVLTAHPTEARRRAVFDGLQRVAAQLERLDRPAVPRSEEADVRRRLLEEIAILWRTSQLRSQRPTPIDEVRRVMAVFDETLFRVVPVVYRELDRVLGPDDVGARPPAFPAFLRWGSWVGGDRDGNPTVTGEVTREALGVQADHVLRGLENAAARIARSLTATAAATPPNPALLASLEADERVFPEAAEAVRWRATDEPHRHKLTLVAERLRATRLGGPEAYPDPDAFREDLRVLQRSLADGGAARLAYGELQHLLWQAETFGFHLASVEVRQHAQVHAEVLDQLTPGIAGDAVALARLAADGWPPDVAPHSDLAHEALVSLRVMAEAQARYGVDACRRYVVSFSRSAADLVAVRALGRLAVPDGSLTLDVVPLFETRADLAAAPGVLDELLALPGEADRLDADGRRLEVMLGYSDSAKDAGFLAANLGVFEAQAALADWARRRGAALTLFHGRGGGLGRGGGPTNRAVRGQAPGSVSGRFKVTEQGEIIFGRYRNIPLASRHLEQVTNAVLVASAPSAEAGGLRDAQRWSELTAGMAAASERAYRALVERPGFAEFFTRVTPSEEISGLRMGSRPARRKAGTDLASLRAIPWVFAWAQSRVNLSGWYGLGTGLATAAATDGGLEQLRTMYQDWPFFASLLENAELSLVKADPLIAALYLDLGDEPELTEAIQDEFALTRRLLLDVTGQDLLLAARPVLRRAVELRNPYVDALSFLQVRYLAELRAGTGDDERLAGVGELVMTTINGVAAGLQNTG